MRRILLYPNPNRDRSFELTLETAGILIANGIEPVIQDDVELRTTLPILRIPLLEGVRASEMIICIGGDGTILRIAPTAAEEGKPILGINAGKVGFLAELEKNELFRLGQILQGNFSIDSRAMLDIRMMKDGETVFASSALNDAVVTSLEGLKVVSLDFWVDEHYIATISGDGLIAATPTGSSAYSLSAGGPLVEPGAELILVTPICAHSLFAKSFVLPGSSTVIIENIANEVKTKLTVDGVHCCTMESGDKAVFRRSERICRLVRWSNHGFYDIIRKKLIV